MNNATPKGLKPFVIKVIALAMSICYVFGPSHNEINNLLHIVTHQFDAPSSILSHSVTNLSEQHNDVHHFEKINDDIHNHKILGFLNKIFKTSNTESNSENSEIVNQKIDKHIRTKKYFKIQNLVLFLQFQKEYKFRIQKIQTGFIKRNMEPPQLV